MHRAREPPGRAPGSSCRPFLPRLRPPLEGVAWLKVTARLLVRPWAQRGSPVSPAPPTRGGRRRGLARGSQPPRLRGGPECKHSGGGQAGGPADTGLRTGMRRVASSPARRSAEPIVRPGLGRGVPAGAWPVRLAPSFNPRWALLHRQGGHGGRGWGDLGYPPTAVSVYRESVCRWYLGASLLAGRADVGGRGSENKDYAGSTRRFAQVCLLGVRTDQTRLARFAFCFHGSACLKVK